MNKKVILQFITGIIFLSFLFSCERNIDIKLPDNPLLIINGALNGHSKDYAAKMYRSAGILSNNNPQAIENGSIILEDVQTGQKDTMIYNNNIANYPKYYYADKIKPIPGKEYKVTALANGFEPVTAKTILPKEVIIYAANWKDSVVKESSNITRDIHIIDFSFNDPANENDYYYLTLERIDSFRNSPTSPVIYTAPTPIFFELKVRNQTNDFIDIDLNNNEIILLQDNDAIIKDNFFSGTTKKIRLFSNFASSAAYKYVIKLSHITEEYYKYLDTRYKQSITEGDPFAQPVLVYSNIKGGAGIFAASFESKKAVTK
jgi:Domain of unknown function (DUF4249)